MSIISEIIEKTKDMSLLYVEDNDTLRGTLSDYLSKIFPKLTLCKDGQDGYEAYLNGTFDIVITDINMPRMDGLEMAKAIKEKSPNQHILIISAHEDIHNYIEAIRVGIDGYLLKPVEYDQFNSELLKIINQITLAKQNELYQNNLQELLADLLSSKTAEIKKRFYKDQLTGLNGKNYLTENLDPAMEQTLVLLNIDNMSILNNNFGYTVGDNVIKEIAAQLQTLVEENFTLCRLQADTFALICHSDCMSEALKLAQKIQNHFDNNPIQTEYLETYISFTISLDSGSDKDLLRNTSLTIQALREKSKHSIGIYQPNTDYELQQQSNLHCMQQIRGYLNQDALVIHYQPIVDVKTQKIEKYEALSRLMGNDGKIIPPSIFIKPVSLSGLNSVLTHKVIDQTLKTLAGHKHNISINITGDDLQSNSMIEVLENKRKEYQVEATQITLEILESVTTVSDPDVLNRLHYLKHLGYKIAIDDFGAESSNFSRLLSFKADYIKIDGSFIKGIVEDENAQVIVKSIVDFAHKVGAKVVAEFVSDEKIFQKIIEYDIDLAQGYYLAKPQSNFLDSEIIQVA